MAFSAKNSLIFIAALVIPFFWIPADDMPVRLSKEIFAMWAGAVILICAVPSWWIRAFIGLCLVHVILNPAENSYWQMGLILCFAGFYMIIRSMDEKAIMCLLAFVCLAAVAQALLVIGQYLGICDPGMKPWHHVRGLSARANDAGAFFVLSLPAFYALFCQTRAWRFRVNLAAGAGIVLLGLWLTQTTAPMVALGAGIVLLAIRWKAQLRLQVALFAALAAVFAVFFIKFDRLGYTLNSHACWTAWSITTDQIALKPWGQGLGSFKDLFPEISRDALSEMDRQPNGTWIQKDAWMQAMNEYLQMAFELGWRPVFVIVAGFLSTFVFKFLTYPLSGIERAAAAGVVMLAVGSAGFFWMHLVDVAFPGVMWIAIWDRGKQRSEIRGQKSEVGSQGAMGL